MAQGLLDFMTSGPIVALVLARPNAVQAWRALMGPTNSLKARAESPRRCAALAETAWASVMHVSSRLAGSLLLELVGHMPEHWLLESGEHVYAYTIQLTGSAAAA